MNEEIKIDELAKEWATVKKIKAEIDAKYEAELRPVNELLTQIEGLALMFLNRTGQSSAITPHGKITKKTTTTYSIINDSKFFDFVFKNQEFNLLSRKILAKDYKDCLDRYNLQHIEGVEPSMRNSLLFTPAKLKQETNNE